MIRRKASMRLVTTWTTWTRAVPTVPIVPIVASVIVGVFFTGAARHAHASLVLFAGEVYCHATAPGPRYFHSGISRVSVDGEHYSRWRLLDERPGWLDERRRDGRILDRVLDDLAVEFARVVAARDDRDVDHLLSFRCELTAAEAAADAIGAASYFRGGERVFYPAAGKIAVEWTPPDFDGLWALASSSYVTWPKAVALVVGERRVPVRRPIAEPGQGRGGRGGGAEAGGVRRDGGIRRGPGGPERGVGRVRDGERRGGSGAGVLLGGTGWDEMGPSTFYRSMLGWTRLDPARTRRRCRSWRSMTSSRRPRELRRAS